MNGEGSLDFFLLVILYCFFCFVLFCILYLFVFCTFLSDPCAHGVGSLGRLVRHTPFVKPCKDLVKTVNVVNVVKT